MGWLVPGLVMTTTPSKHIQRERGIIPAKRWSRAILFLATMAVAATDGTACGQAPALEAGSVGAARAIAQAINQGARAAIARRKQEAAAREARRKQEAAAKEAWQNSAKLTLLEIMPKTRRDQASCLSLSNLRNDSIGYLECWELKVLNVVGPKDLLLRVTGPNNLLQKMGYSLPDLWLAGYSTAGLVDDDRVRLVGVLEVVGTRKYTTVSGATTTVRAVQFASRKRLAELSFAGKAAALVEFMGKAERAESRAKAWAAEKAAHAARAQEEASQKAKEEAAIEAAKWRTWTTADGKYTVEAKFIKYRAGKVTLERKDEATIDVELNRLCQEDQDFIRRRKYKR